MHLCYFKTENLLALPISPCTFKIFLPMFSLLLSFSWILNFLKLLIKLFFPKRELGFEFCDSCFLSSLTHPKTKGPLFSGVFPGGLTCRDVAPPDSGSTHIVYEKQKDDDVMPCLDSMQMTKVDKKKTLLSSCIQYFPCDDTQAQLTQNTCAHMGADKLEMIMVMIRIVAVITVSSTMLKINLSQR